MQKMAAGETEAELLKAYPQLSKADLTAVWEYVARAATEEIVLAEPLSASVIRRKFECAFSPIGDQHACR